MDSSDDEPSDDDGPAPPADPNVDALDPRTPWADVIAHNAKSAALYLLAHAQMSRRTYGEPLDLQNPVHLQLVTEKLAATLKFGNSFDAKCGTPWLEMPAAMEKLGKKMKKHGLFKLGGQGNGEAFKQPQPSAAITTHTYPLASDQNTAELAEWQPTMASAEGGGALYFCMDKHGKPCWQALTHLAAEHDAEISFSWRCNSMWMHDETGQKYNHNSTPASRCKVEQGKLLVEMIGRSGRFSTWNIDGKVGRELVELGCNTSLDPIYCIAVDSSAIYRRVLDRPVDDRFVSAGQFRANLDEELILLVSQQWPHALVVSFLSSTTDPHGSKPLLRSPRTNRLVFSADLFGKRGGSLYGNDDSLCATLSSSRTMGRLEAILKEKKLLPVSCKLGVPGQYHLNPGRPKGLKQLAGRPKGVKQPGAQQIGAPQRCSRCGIFGHKKGTCTAEKNTEYAGFSEKERYALSKHYVPTPN